MVEPTTSCYEEEDERTESMLKDLLTLDSLTTQDEESPALYWRSFHFQGIQTLSTIDEFDWFDSSGGASSTGTSWSQDADAQNHVPSKNQKLPERIVLIEGGPLGDKHAAVSPTAVTPKARSHPHKVQDIAAKLIRQFHTLRSFSSSSWTHSSCSTNNNDRFHRKRIILIGEHGDERDVLVLDRKLDISSS